MTSAIHNEGSDFDGAEIDEPGFRFLGWLDDIEVRWEGLDDHDPLATAIADDRTVPGSDFVTFHQLSVDATGCRYRATSGDLYQSTDTLSRWMAHRVAELMERAEHART